MTVEALKARIPDYARDIRLNLSSVLASTHLTPRQAWGAALASAIAARNGDLVRAITADAQAHLTPEEANAARASAAIMGMNNVYYRFVHLAGNKDYGSMPARLRMNVLANPGVDKVDFELWSLAVSAVNGCGLCIEAHERELLEKGASRDMIQDAVRIAAVVHAAAVTLDAEASSPP
ncbi:MAG: carboxymuconolactone decarboxylase family protein [Pseudomonadota bacterium]|nr:carboxymuconolactone decarboxylase family protein [Pseudomonadota bacterium]